MIQEHQRIGARRHSFIDILRLLKPANVMAEQLHPVYSNSRSVLLANAIAAAFIAYSMHSTEASGLAFGWAMSCLLVNICSAVAVSVSQRAFLQRGDIVKASWIVSCTTALRGLVWGLGFATLLPLADMQEQIILGWMIAGLMCGGAFSAWSHPAAAVSFTALTGVGGALGMAGVPGMAETWMPYITVVLFLLLVRAVFTSVMVLRQSVEAERDITMKNQVIGLLLKDFEESSSDWLWQTDASGNLTRGAGRFARVLELPVERTRNYGLLAITEIYGNPALDNSGLIAALGAHEAFSGEVLALGETGHERFLKISAKPVRNKDGEFTGWQGVSSDVTDERLADMKVRKLALFDTLTELPNRTFFYDRLHAMLEASGRTPSWVMYLDLDGFKAVNDTFGHAAGDQLLRSVGARLSACLPAKGMLARLGGDEFAILGVGPRSRIEAYGKRIISEMSEPCLIGTQEVSIGISIGIAEVNDWVKQPDELMRRADVALYAAKSSGKGIARFYDEDMDRSQLRRKDIEMGLRKALAQELFHLHYQPIVDIASGQTQAFETLLRFNTPELGDVAPSEFIPVAEETGLIAEIGEWVIRQACQDASHWPSHIYVAVNVSPLQLKSNRILAVVTQALADASLAPSRLELELTESALVENVEQTTRILSDLKMLGVKLALDDFGTGYSSLSHLHQFNFDKIKIDRSFVQSFGTRRESTAVVNAVVHLARDLGITMTAEGVETDAHLMAMRNVGCDQAQGFLLGRPQPLAATDKAHTA